VAAEAHSPTPAAPRSISDVLADLDVAYLAENGPEFRRLVTLLYISITPAQEQVAHDPSVWHLFQPVPLITDPTTRQRLDPHLQQIERMLLHGLHYLSAIHAQQRRLLMNTADINALLDRIDKATNNVAADIKFLIGEITPGMSQADVDAVGGRLTAAATTLETIASANQPPAPPAPVPTPGATGSAAGTPAAPTNAAGAAPDGSTFSGETGAGPTGRVAS
jgi:hypothetical protein